MARRKGGIDRDALREKLIAIAEALVTQGGPEALTARALAAHIGYSLGHVYNLVDDLNELILLVNARTLDRLHDELIDAAEEAKPGQRLHGLAQAYLKFCADNPQLWALVLEHRLPAGAELPPDYAERVANLPELVLGEIRLLFPKRSAENLKRDVAMLWSAMHGLASLSQSRRLDLIHAPSPAVLARHLIDTFINSLKEAKHG